tara:strand:+ start:2827 stop:3423 length:597 start_codon:yes stop_codon:yes gene_type:complete
MRLQLVLRRSAIAARTTGISRHWYFGVTIQKRKIVVIGNGMVGHRFIEKLIGFDKDRSCQVTTFCEESRAAYDRVGLTSFFAHRDAEKLMIARREWYACQNVCPHMNAFVLSRGIVGSRGEEPKVACPLHKKTFSLKTGQGLSGEPLSVKVFPVRVDDGEVYLKLPPESQLDALLATDLHSLTKQSVCDMSSACAACV